MLFRPPGSDSWPYIMLVMFFPSFLLPSLRGRLLGQWDKISSIGKWRC